MRLHWRKALILIAICTLLIFWKQRLTLNKEKVYEKVDIISERNKIKLSSNCGELTKIEKFDPLVYKKKKWIKDKTRQLRKLHKHDKYDYTSDIKNEFNKLCHRQVEIERSLVENLHQLRSCDQPTRGEGRGIVIPVENIDNVLRLVRVLKSDLPIQFVSHSESDRLKKYGTVIKVNGPLLIQAALYNTFDEFIVISEHVLPLVDLERFFAFDRFKERGIYLFKSPTVLSNRITKFTPGFHETASLLQLLVPKKGYTSKFFDQQFSFLIDTHLMVMKKSVVSTGLKISEYMFSQQLVKLRVVDSDLIWLGQEIAGVSIPFNFNYAVAAGVYTPTELQSREICSSSYGQVSDKDDVTLLYVTTHQLENSLNSKFKFLFDRYKVKKTEHVSLFNSQNSINKIDLSIYSKLIGNPLTIENIIKPPTLLNKVYVHSFEEPDEAWMLQKNDFDLKYPYYCVYEIVGNPLKEGTRGLTVNIDTDLQKKYHEIIKRWLGDEFN